MRDVLFDITMDDIQRQLRLEHQGIDEGINRYRQKRIDAVTHNKDMSQLDPEFRLMQNVLEPVATGIRIMFAGGGRGQNRAKRFGKVMKQIREIEPFELAFIAVRHCLQIVEREPLQYTSVMLGKTVENHRDYLNFKQEKPAYLRAVESNLKSSHTRHRHRVLTHARHRMGVEDVDWTEDERFQVGRLLLEIAIKQTGCWKLAWLPKDEKLYHSFQPTDKLKQWIKDVDERCELLTPLLMPTVIPPVPWEGYVGGGYYTETREMKRDLIRSRKDITREVFEQGDSSQVLKALNTIQDTPWKINTRILEVMEVCAKTGLAGLPIPDVELQLPPKLWNSDDEFKYWSEHKSDEVKAWKADAARAWDRWHREMSGRKALGFKLMLARKFKDEKAIWFPHSLDWRGRIYPMANFLNPQGDDSAKALLMFAEGKQLGETGSYWLAVHLANTWGEDKVSFQDRVDWVVRNELKILASAKSPLEHRWWMDADKPFCFLAACMEWADYMKEGASYVSHLPIAMDGSCSGLQHFSGLLRDPVGGKSVNLVPGEVPADVYADVAEVVNDMLKIDIHDHSIWKGIKSNETLTPAELAALWYGKVDRLVTKRNCMTKCYGATRRGYETQLRHVCMKKDKPGESFIDGDVYLACKYLAEVNDIAIGKVVVKAQEAMDWIQKVAKIVSAAGETVQWTTPIGLKVVQDYRKTKTKRINTYFGETRVQVGLRKDTERLDTRGMSNGLSPNYVHSMDSAHLMLTVLSCREQGLTSFGLIHDSFAVHACDTNILHEAIRDTFVDEMYQGDRLMEFYEEVCSHVPAEVAEKLPTPPAQGDLDLECVRRSTYFFA